MMGGGAAFFDYDGDSDLDLWLSGGIRSDVLLENDGTGHFTEVSVAAGLVPTGNYPTSSVLTGDIDNDGDRDVFLTTSSDHPNRLFRNDGGVFTDATSSAGLLGDTAWSTNATFGDYNLDGYLDLYVGNYIETRNILVDSTGTPTGYAHECAPNWLYLNNGDFTFTEVSAWVGGADTGCALASAWSGLRRRSRYGRPDRERLRRVAGDQRPA